MMLSIAGLLVLCIVLQGSASMLSSTRGERGLVVALCVFAAAWAVQRVLHREGWREIGVSATIRGLAVALVLSVALTGAAGLYVRAIDAQVSVYPSAVWLALGILAQGGVAEELVFRGYLYGRLRRTRTFWLASSVSIAPFAAVHLGIFFTTEWPIAFAALVLSMALSFPYAHLYELGGRTIWAPALMHAVTQAGPKLLVIEDAAFPVVWMMAALAVSWCVFSIPRTGPEAC
jgi:membrane protease YdiL (CAAX protease family)